MIGNTSADVVFLFDVDNTLLDNDRIIADLRSHLEAAFGSASAARYWAAFEALRAELGYAERSFEVTAQVGDDPVVVEQRVVDIEQEHHVGSRVPAA